MTEEIECRGTVPIERQAVLNRALARAFAVLHPSKPVAARRVGVAVEEIFRGATTHDPIGHGIGMALVCVTGLADPTRETKAPRLLHEVSRLVGDSADRWLRGGKGDSFAVGVGFGAHGRVGIRRTLVRVRLNTAQVVAAKGRLNPAQMRERTARPGHTRGGVLVDGGTGPGSSPRRDREFMLHRRLSRPVGRRKVQ